MAMNDASLFYSTEQAITLAQAADSENILDFGVGVDAFGVALVPDYGRAAAIYFNIVVRTAVTSDSSATVTFALQHCDTSGGSYETVWQSAAIAKATLIIGAVAAQFVLPAGMKRYSKVIYTPSHVLTAGKFDAYLSWTPSSKY